SGARCAPRDPPPFPTRRSSDLDPRSGLRLGFDATSLTAAGKGLARFQREFLRTAAELGEPSDLVVFVPEEPEEGALPAVAGWKRSEEHTSELQSHLNLVCRLLL